VDRIPVEPPESQRIRHVARTQDSARDLDERGVVVCLGSELATGDVARARTLAEQHGAAVGGTLAVCERGDLPRNRQIGLYGRAVAPRLLVTVGVPGFFEELTGFVKAHAIIAVNHAAGAPMLTAADAGAVVHWENAIPALAAAL
jgi:electron transfer flavoprotein alpha subunit